MSGKEIIAIIVAGIVALVGIASIFFGCAAAYRYYEVWSQEMQGAAELARASQNKQILIEQARAEKEAAMERAEAIRIVGEASAKYPEYRQQEFIGAFANAIQDGRINQIIYVPTEGNIPITEAHRLGR